jgi:hypothetical protein
VFGEGFEVLHDGGEGEFVTAWQTSAAKTLKQTESLFAKNREPFFNSIDPERPSAPSGFCNALSLSTGANRNTGVTEYAGWITPA